MILSRIISLFLVFFNGFQIDPDYSTEYIGVLEVTIYLYKIPIEICHQTIVLKKLN